MRGLLILPLALLACAPPPLHLRWSGEPGPATDPAGVQFYWASPEPDARPSAERSERPEGRWPVGVVMSRRGVVAEPAYPSAEDPHRYLARFEVRTTPGEVLETIRRRAAGLGANAVVVSGRWPTRFHVLHLGDEARLRWPEAESLWAEIHSEQRPARDWKPVGAPTKRSLEAMQPWTVELRRGWCYAMGWALDPDARWRHELVGVPDSSQSPVRVKWPLDAVASFWLRGGGARQGWWAAGSPLGQRAGWVDLVCPRSDARLPVTIQRYLSWQHQGEDATRLGTGGVHLRLYGLELGEARTKVLEAEHDAWVARGRARSATFNAGERRRVCRACMPLSPRCTVEVGGRRWDCERTVRCLADEIPRVDLDTCLRLRSR